MCSSYGDYNRRMFALREPPLVIGVLVGTFHVGSVAAFRRCNVHPPPSNTRAHTSAVVVTLGLQTLNERTVREVLQDKPLHRYLCASFVVAVT